MELAEQVATNAPLTNFAVLQALPMIAEANPQTGLLMESLMATVAQSDKEAKTADPRLPRPQDRQGEAGPDIDKRRACDPTCAVRRAQQARAAAPDLVRRSRRHHRAPRRRHHLSAARSSALGEYPDRLTDQLHHWAEVDAGPHLHGGARPRPAAGGELTYAATAGLEPAYRLGAAGARPVRRTAGGHPVRQFDRPRADRVRRALCGRFRSARCRRPIRWCRRITASSAT